MIQHMRTVLWSSQSSTEKQSEQTGRRHGHHEMLTLAYACDDYKEDDCMSMERILNITHTHIPTTEMQAI